jgi:hypothetical protein
MFYIEKAYYFERGIIDKIFTGGVFFNGRATGIPMVGTPSFQAAA